MFKIFSFKYKNEIQAIKSLYRKSYLDFNYSRDMEKKQKLKIYTRDYIVRLHNLLKFRTYYGDMTIKKFRKYLQ
jgi:hypothetical protein